MGVGKYLVLVLVLLPFACADLREVIDNSSERASDFLDGIPKEDMRVVVGSKISIEEQILFNLLKGAIPQSQGVEVDKDTNFHDDGKTLILIGSQRTNHITKRLSGTSCAYSEDVFPPVVLGYMENDAKRSLVIYSVKETISKENLAPEKGVLAGLMDKRYVPWVASFLSMLLLYLWSILGRTIVSLVSDMTSSKLVSKITEKKRVQKKHLHKLRLHEYLTYPEIIAMFLTTLVFSITMSWSYSDNLKDFLSVFQISIAVVGCVTFAREIVRLYLCYKHKIRSEYVFWPFGTVITFISTFLGNTFSLVSYTLVDTEGHNEKTFGQVSFFISLFTLLTGLTAYILNIFAPSVVLQMLFVYCVMAVFIEMFPLAPMAGADVLKWKKVGWIVFYLICFGMYVTMNFTSYV